MDATLDTPTAQSAPARTVRTLGVVVVLAGILMVLGGATTWFMVQGQLADERITVADDADFLAGDDVNGPFSAYAQATIIEKHALESSGGKTYAELPREDPARTSVMNGSFLRASLFTSVLAFGVAAMAVGLGALLVLVGWALTLIARQVAAAPPAASPA